MRQPPFVVLCEEDDFYDFCRPGSDLLSRVLRQSTIGAEAFDGRVRDGIGSCHFARATRPAKVREEAKLGFWRLLQPLSMLHLERTEGSPADLPVGDGH